jgi:ribosomal protein S18 acetylase RimI-like enzyme
MEIAVRRAGVDDAGALSLVARATFLETYAHMIRVGDMLAHARTLNDEGYFARWAAHGETALWLAETQPWGAPIGYAALTTPDLPVQTGPGDVELRRIYVLSRFHKTGTGARLMQAACAEAAARGKARVLLGTNKHNATALRFYERSGFAIVGERTFKVGETLYDDFVLARPIQAG